MVSTPTPAMGNLTWKAIQNMEHTQTTPEVAAQPADIESGLRRATEQQQAYLNEAKALYEPYREAGAQSLDEYVKLLMGGVDSLSGDKNFQAMQDLAERKVMANRATSGLLRSGATASALSDSMLNFANRYYGNRLSQLQQGVNYGTYGTDAQTSILDKLGTSGTDLASALANIQMQRESNDAMIKAAQAQAAATTSAAKSSSKSNLLGGILGTIGTVVGSIYGGPLGGAAGGALGSKAGEMIS